MRIGSDARVIGRLGLVLAVLGVAGILTYSSIASGADQNKSSTRGAKLRQAVTSSMDDLNISTFGWKESATDPGNEILTLESGQDARLKDCGSNAWDESMLVLAPAGIAYCLEPIDRSDADSVAAARIIALRMYGAGPFTDAELQYLWIETLLGYATPESPAAAQYRHQQLEVWKSLTAEEKDHLLNL